MKVLVQFVSVSRAIAGLVFVTIAFVPSQLLSASIVYIYACTSDMIDGYLARRYSCRSEGGAALDLFGDKYLTIASALYSAMRDMPIIACALIILREVFLLAMRSVRLDGKQLFPPDRLLGGLMVLPIWSTTFLLMHTPENLQLSLDMFVIAYWTLGIVASASLVMKVVKDRKNLLKALK